MTPPATAGGQPVAALQQYHANQWQRTPPECWAIQVGALVSVAVLGSCPTAPANPASASRREPPQTDLVGTAGRPCTPSPTSSKPKSCSKTGEPNTTPTGHTNPSEGSPPPPTLTTGHTNTNQHTHHPDSQPGPPQVPSRHSPGSIAGPRHRGRTVRYGLSNYHWAPAGASWRDCERSLS